MPRVELNLSLEVLATLQVKADALGMSRKRYLETLCINEAMTEPQPVLYNAHPSAPRPESGQYLKSGIGYVFEYNDQLLYVSSPIFYHDNFQFHFTGESGLVDDAILL